MAAASFATDYDLASRQVVRPLGHGFDLVITPRYRQHYVDNRYEALTASLVSNLARRRRLFIDVGAHCGFYSFLAAAANPELRAVAIEPVAETFELLSEGARLNGLAGRFEAVRAAASDRTGTAALNVTEASDNCGFYSHTASTTLRTVEVPTVTLDALLAGRDGRESAVVKIDTDGHELPVLAGMGELLAAAEDPRLIVELNPQMQRQAGHAPEDLVAELHRLGFEVFLVDDWLRRYLRLRQPGDWARFCPPEAYANLYCAPRERALSVVTFSHSSGLQGAERCLAEFVTAAVQDHGAVCTVALPDDGPLRQRLEDAGAAILVAEIPWWCGFIDLGPEVARFRVERGLAALCQDVLPLLEQVDPDVVETMTLTLPWGAAAAAALDKPHVWMICEYGERDHGLRFFSPFDEVRRAIAASSNLVLTLGERLRRALFPDLGDERCRAVGLWVDPPPGPPPAEVPGRRAPGRRRLAVLASIVEGKDQATAVRALAELVGRGRDVELLLAGHANEDYLRAVRGLIAELGLEDRVEIPGFCDDPYSVLAGADVVVNCSTHEAFGRTALEAALIDCPAVIASTSGAAELLRHGLEALWFEPGDAGGLADGVEALLDDRELARRLCAGAREVAATRLSRETVGDLRFQLFRGLRGRPNAYAQDAVQRLVAAAARSAAIRADHLFEELGRARSDLGARLAAEEERHREELSHREEELSRTREELSRVREERLRVVEEQGRQVEELGRKVEAAAGRAAALEDELAYLRGTATWRWRARLLGLPVVVRLYRLLKRA